MDDDGLKIFDRKVDVVEPDLNRSVGIAFVATTVAAVVLGLFGLWVLANVVIWVAQNVLAHIYLI